MENGKIVKKNGKGIIIYKSGNKYDGYWEEGKKSGKGIYYFKNGDFFKGEWKNGKKNGKGIFYYKDKNLEEEGFWEDDILKKEDI